MHLSKCLVKRNVVLVCVRTCVRYVRVCACVCVCSDRSGELDFSTFLGIMYKQHQQESPEQEILDALNMADKDQRGYLLASELRTKLTSLGEKLTDAEGEGQ